MAFTESDWKQRIDSLLAEKDFIARTEKFTDAVTEVPTLETFGDFQAWFEPFKNSSCFRGLKLSRYPLSTTLDRATFKTIRPDGFMISLSEKYKEQEFELSLLRRFRRGAHHYLSSVPNDEDTVDWLALMQHYGAATRMMDWSKSPYVALYFAMQAMDGCDSDDAAIWAINLEWLHENFAHLSQMKELEHEDRQKYVNRLLMSDAIEKGMIIHAEPRRLNDRMDAQQGVLLCKLRRKMEFIPSLMQMVLGPEPQLQQVVSKVRISRKNRLAILAELQRMNIHEASLFPGLEGFSRSLGLDVALEIEQANVVDKAKFLRMLMPSDDE